MPTIYFSPQLRRMWPVPLASQWREAYSQIIDDDDLRQIKKRPTHHFFEWYLAIHLFQRHGLFSLVEKAQYVGSHPRKREIIGSLMGRSTFDRLCEICGDCGVQWPDLVCYRPSQKGFLFAEAKGPDDSLSAAQIKSHRRIEKYLGRAVKVYDIFPLHAAT